MVAKAWKISKKQRIAIARALILLKEAGFGEIAIDAKPPHALDEQGETTEDDPQSPSSPNRAT